MNLLFDIGYNKGLFTKECHRLFPNCKVVAVEANVNLVRDVVATNNLAVINALVSNKPNEYVDFYVEHSQPGISTASKKYIQESRFAKGSSFLPPASGRWSSPIKVNSITLDQLVKKFGSPDLIKIDVEGYEYEVLLGLTKKQNKICFEWHEEDYEGLQKCVEHLKSLGYEKFGVIGYFVEGNREKMTFDERADPYMVEPKEFFSWEEIKKELETVCKSDRRVNYGMFFAC